MAGGRSITRAIRAAGYCDAPAGRLAGHGFQQFPGLDARPDQPAVAGDFAVFI